MALSVSRCEELVAPRYGAPQASRDEAGARDKATRRVALQPVQASSSYHQRPAFSFALASPEPIGIARQTFRPE
jgi:hypothetical protein